MGPGVHPGRGGGPRAVPRQVAVYEPGEPVRMLRAPGILRNPVPVPALYDREATPEVVLRNLLQRRGYANLEVVRAEGAAGSILTLLEYRGIEVDDETRARILTCRERLRGEV